MSSLRDQFKATSTKALKKLVEEEDSHLPTGGKYSDTLKYTEGDNKFRIFPKHPGESNFYKMLAQHWITIENDEGKEVRRTVNNSKIHGGTDKDIIEEYVAYCSQNLDSTDKDDADKIKQLTDYNGGLGMSTSWICYAKKINKGGANEFGLLELKKTIRDAMNKLSISEDEEEAIETDPFTDPSDGKPIIVTYKSSAQAKDKYQTKISKNVSELTDDELEVFAKKTPLSKLDKFQYDRSSFELALEGLRYFDEKYEINLFDSEGFQEIVEEMSSLYSGKVGGKSSKKSKNDDDDDDAPFEEDEKPKKTTKKPIIKKPSKKDEDEDDSEEDEDIYDSDDDEDSSDEEEEEEKPAKKTVVVKKSTSKKQQQEEEESDEAEEDEEEEEEKPAPKKPGPKPADKKPASGGKSSASMDEIKKRLSGLTKKK